MRLSRRSRAQRPKPLRYRSSSSPPSEMTFRDAKMISSSSRQLCSSTPTPVVSSMSALVMHSSLGVSAAPMAERWRRGALEALRSY